MKLRSLSLIVAFLCASFTGGPTRAQSAFPSCGSTGGIPGLTRCFVEKKANGDFIVWVEGAQMMAGDSIILIDGRPCTRYYYPKKYLGEDGRTIARIGASGRVKDRLPGVVSVLNVSTGCVIANSLQCDRP